MARRTFVRRASIARRDVRAAGRYKPTPHAKRSGFCRDPIRVDVQDASTENHLRLSTMTVALPPAQEKSRRRREPQGRAFPDRSALRHYFISSGIQIEIVLKSLLRLLAIALLFQDS
jgi:hypothetical protein